MPSSQEALAKVNQAVEQLTTALSDFTSSTASTAETQINESAASAAEAAKAAITVAQDQLARALAAVKSAVDKAGSPPEAGA